MFHTLSWNEAHPRWISFQIPLHTDMFLTLSSSSILQQPNLNTSEAFVSKVVFLHIDWCGFRAIFVTIIDSVVCNNTILCAFWEFTHYLLMCNLLSLEQYLLLTNLKHNIFFFSSWFKADSATNSYWIPWYIRYPSLAISVWNFGVVRSIITPSLRPM